MRPNNPYVPSIVFERPVGVSHRMGFGSTGPWIPEVGDYAEISSNPLAVPLDSSKPAAETQPHNHGDDDIQTLGSYIVGGSSGSGRSRSSATSAVNLPAGHASSDSAVIVPAGHASSAVKSPAGHASGSAVTSKSGRSCFS